MFFGRVGSDGFVEGGSGGVSQSCKNSLQDRSANRVSDIVPVGSFDTDGNN